ncbi:MAG: hypothetical protein HQK54_04800, partial [Oligoflexales bacterium]|nr:hypothetical protein [Oligoflexales bacterium]
MKIKRLCYFKARRTGEETKNGKPKYSYLAYIRPMLKDLTKKYGETRIHYYSVFVNNSNPEQIILKFYETEKAGCYKTPLKPDSAKSYFTIGVGRWITKRLQDELLILLPDNKEIEFLYEINDNPSAVEVAICLDGSYPPKEIFESMNEFEEITSKGKKSTQFKKIPKVKKCPDKAAFSLRDCERPKKHPNQVIVAFNVHFSDNFSNKVDEKVRDYTLHVEYEKSSNRLKFNFVEFEKIRKSIAVCKEYYPLSVEGSRKRTIYSRVSREIFKDLDNFNELVKDKNLRSIPINKSPEDEFLWYADLNGLF